VTLLIAPVNDPPVAADDSFAADEDLPHVLEVLANDTDVEGDTLTPLIVDGPLHGTLTPNADGSFTYTPDANFFGDDGFTYRASDGDLQSGLATVSVTINSVNDLPVAEADAFETDEDTSFDRNVLANDSDVEDGRPATVGAVNGDAANVSTTLVLTSGALLTVNADGSFSYDPNGQFETLAVGATAFDSFTYVARDADGAESNTASVSIAILGVNDAPVANDDVIPGAGGGAIRVAVIGGANSTYLDATAQLNQHGPGLDIVATAILVSSVSNWTETLANYDVVVIGENGTAPFDYDGVQVFAALRDFLDAGGGVITTGVFASRIGGYTDATTRADADYISPAASFPDSLFAGSGSLISISDASHAIAGGITSYAAQGLHEVAGATDATATVLATDSLGRAAIAYDEIVAGRTVFLGSTHMAIDQAPFDPGATRTGLVDQIFEQAVVWAAGDQGSGATTDEDAIYVIDDASLLANDTDVDGDSLFISSVAATSLLGAALSIDTDGNIVYDPTSAPLLQALAAGVIADDSFSYTVSDGHGGFDTANVSLTVSGVNDAPDAVNDARSTNEDTPLAGNVLDNDTDAEGDALTVTSAGSITSARGAAVTLAADGAFSYDPTGSAELQALAFGASVVDTFSYTISDGKLADTATVGVTVAGVNEPGSGDGGASAAKVASSVAPGADLDYYIRIEGVSGGEWLHLDAFSLGLMNSGSASAGGGAGAGKASASDVSAVLGSSAALVELTAALAAGTHLKSVEIEAYLPGSEKGGQLLDQYYFEDVLMTGLQTGGSAFSTASQLSFDFVKFNHGHVEYGKDGSVASTSEAGFDFAALKDFTGGPAVAGDALKGQQDLNALPTDVDLQYYVSFEGSGGWLELGSFSMGLANSGALSGSGGALAGKVSASDVALLLGSSGQILDLTDGVTTGQHFKFLEVEAYLPGGDKGSLLVDEYYFEDVVVSALQTSNASTNQVSVDYAKFSHGHVEYDAKTGAALAPTSVGWDFVLNTAWDHGAPDADVIL